MKVGLGILTHARPRMFERLARSVVEHLGVTDVDAIAVHGYPGEGAGYGDATDMLRAWAKAEDIDWRLRATHVPLTVAQGKNRLLHMLDDCDWVILAEDDVEVISDKAIFGYIDAAILAGVGHLAFHAHGPENGHGAGNEMGPVTAWPASIGAWNLYSRLALDAVGYFDEGFHNCWEHVEHTMRLARAGFGGGARSFLDATGSERWLREQPFALQQSVIRADPDWGTHMEDGRRYWRSAHPDTFHDIWPGGL